MFIHINFYFRPYEFLAVYQRFAYNILMSCSDSTYIRVLEQYQK
jgi:hypothetical protein